MGRFPNVIKASSLNDTPGVSLRSFHFNDVMEEAKRLVREAQAKAEEIVQTAVDRQEAIEKAAYEKGFKAGYDKGYAEGLETGKAEAFDAAKKEFNEKQATLIESYRKTIDAINADRAAWIASSRHDLVELAMAVARKVAHHVGDQHREVILANLEEAVRLAGARTDVTIAVNLKDAETARLFVKSLVDMHEQWQNIRIVEESEIAPGGCRVHWGSGAIDATIDTQLDRIAMELIGHEERIGRGEEE